MLYKQHPFVMYQILTNRGPYLGIMAGCPVRTVRRDFRTKMTEGHHSTVWLDIARLESSLLLGTRIKLVYFEFTGFTEQKDLLLTISVETVRVAKYRIRTNLDDRVYLRATLPHN